MKKEDIKRLNGELSILTMESKLIARNIDYVSVVLDRLIEVQINQSKAQSTMVALLEKNMSRVEVNQQKIKTIKIELSKGVSPEVKD